jgi:hypothetical protein
VVDISGKILGRKENESTKEIQNQDFRIASIIR